MTEHSPIIPPPELIEDWRDEWKKSDQIVHLPYTHIAIRASQWGADQELEACCDVLKDWGSCLSPDLRAARRPKPLSLKQQALQELDKVDMLWCTEDFDQVSQKALETIRKALEALPDD